MIYVIYLRRPNESSAIVIISTTVGATTSCALLLARASTSQSVTIGRNAIARGLCLTGGTVPLLRSGCEGSAVEDRVARGGQPTAGDVGAEHGLGWQVLGQLPQLTPGLAGVGGGGPLVELLQGQPARGVGVSERGHDYFPIHI